MKARIRFGLDKGLSSSAEDMVDNSDTNMWRGDVGTEEVCDDVRFRFGEDADVEASLVNGIKCRLRIGEGLAASFSGLSPPRQEAM